MQNPNIKLLTESVEMIRQEVLTMRDVKVAYNKFDKVAFENAYAQIVSKGLV
jgi:hypothetical protein